MDEKQNGDSRADTEPEKLVQKHDPRESEGFVDAARDDGASDLHRLTVAWWDFGIASEAVASGDEVEAFLNRTTGEVAIIFPDSDDEDELRERIEEDWDNWLGIEKMDSRAAFKVIKRFAMSREDSKSRDLLVEALSGPRPFRRFKDALHRDEDVRQAWYSFETAAKKEAIEDWFAFHRIQVDWKRMP